MKVLITAGPTREPIDPVRFLSNRSSGKMGFALAEAAVACGCETVLVAGPVNLPTPAGLRRVDVETAAGMYEAVAEEMADCQVAILSAAVADYRPAQPLARKLKKTAGPLTLMLEPTPDILGSLRQPLGFRGYLVGFAAETDNLEANAFDKLRRKDCDLVVANDVSRADIGFDQEENEVLLCYRDGRREWIARTSKRAIAQHLMAAIRRATPQGFEP